MFNSDNRIAIDIGSKFIKIVHGRKKKEGISIIDYEMLITPENSYSHCNINDKRDILKAVKSYIEEKKIKSGNVIIGVRGSDIIIRNFEMPMISDKQFKKAVEFEVQQYLPMDPNEYEIASKKAGWIEEKSKKALNVLMVAAPKRKVKDHYFIASKLGLTVNAIDHFANSVTRFFEKDESKNDSNYKTKCTVLLDIGYDTSTVTIIENGRLFLEKQLYTGVRDIDAVITKVFVTVPEDIEALRKSTVSLLAAENQGDTDDPRIYYANNNTKQIVDTLIDGMMKVFDFYYSSGYDKSIECIYIHGGGSRLKGIDEYIKNSTNIDTKLFNKDLLNNINNIDDEFNENIHLYANCISLLLRKE